MATKKNDLLEALFLKSYKKNYKPPEEQKVLRIREKICGTLQNIVIFSGLPKAGKSTFLSGCMASAFMKVPVFGIKLDLPPKRGTVAVFDTESSEYDFYRSMDRVKNFLQLANLPDCLNSFMFRDCSHLEIKEYIEIYLKNNPKCSVIFIDGMLDLLINHNDEVESKLTIQWLKKITAVYNILLIGVVHLGKSTNNTLGNFGSMIDRYSQSVIAVEKDKKNNRIDLVPKMLRSDADFDTISIQIVNGYPVEI